MDFTFTEVDILCGVQESLLSNNFIYYEENSFSKHLKKWLLDKDTITEDSGHDAYPPDFYSDKNSFMFDVMRIFDSEKKGKNSVLSRQVKLRSELSQQFSDDVDIIVSSEYDGPLYDIEHNISQYYKQFDRVVEKHIKKVNRLWIPNHLNIKYKGLLICDETELYFGGRANKINIPGKWMYTLNKQVAIHMPWRDLKFIDSVRKAETANNCKLDFIIWFFPYKQYSELSRTLKLNYPKVIIQDIRYHIKTINYDHAELIPN